MVTPKFIPALILFFCMAGCWGTPWPHRSFTIDLSRARADQEEVANVAKTFLMAHGLTDAGKAGQDIVNNTVTVLNFKRSDGLLVSVFLNRKGMVPVSFDQDGPAFSEEAQQLFDEFLSYLERKWPGAVTLDPIPDRR
jgi:hypothetical protein